MLARLTFGRHAKAVLLKRVKRPCLSRLRVGTFPGSRVTNWSSVQLYKTKTE